MKFGLTSATLALKCGLVAAGLQFLVLLVLLDKVVRPDLDVGSVFSMLVLLGLVGTAFAGFWLLRRSPELSYFALAVGAGLFLFVAGFLTLPTIGLFVLPGTVAILLSALMFLFAGEDPLPLWRRVSVVSVGLLWLIFMFVQLYGAGYLLKAPGFGGPAVKKIESRF